MRIAVDTNILVRSAVQDDPKQAGISDHILREASLLAVSLSVMCEFVWVIQSRYSFSNTETQLAIEALLDIPTVHTNRAAVEAGLRLMILGGDFSDGVHAYEGRRLGGDTFISFDKKAVRLLSRQGYDALTPDRS